METQITKFDYGQLDGETADFLWQKERNMREIVGKAYTALGRELKEAQDVLAHQGSKYDGVFVSWYRYMGYKDRTVYNLIDRIKLLQNLQKVEEMETVESLPVSLSYEISAPSSESTEPKRQAKQAVLNGDIRTRKEYLELVARLEAEEKARKEAVARAEKAEQDYEVVRDTLSEEISVRDERISQIEREKEELKTLEATDSDFERVRRSIQDVHTDRHDVKRQMDSAVSISELYIEVEHLLKNKLAPIRYSRALLERRDSKVVMDNLRGILDVVKDWTQEMEVYLPSGNYIDIKSEV